MTNLTHSDIFTKFMIEYDKSNVTSSYPSLTKYEIATILDKAYLALIALKITGNNPRKSTFESDVKAVEDLRKLLRHTPLVIDTKNTQYLDQCTNRYVYELPNSATPGQFLYFIQADATYKNNAKANVRLVTHEIANNFKVTDINYPWVKEPVCCIDDHNLFVYCDPQKEIVGMNLTYLAKPVRFADNVTNGDTIEFELTDSMAEELINLAITMALENVESTRLQTKITTSQFES